MVTYTFKFTIHAHNLVKFKIKKYSVSCRRTVSKIYTKRQIVLLTRQLKNMITEDHSIEKPYEMFDVIFDTLHIHT